MTKSLRTRTTVFAVGALASAALGCGGADGVSIDSAGLKVHSAVPESIDPDARYLIYLHGRIIEDEGSRPTHPRFGVYEYQEILEAFAARGFVVISEQRPAGTVGSEYAKRVVNQVETLLEAGVAPECVTVVGFSKGDAIAILASSMVDSVRVNYVFIGACGSWLESRPDLVAKGRLLSLREASDDLVTSCAELFARREEGGVQAEIVFELGGGHGAFYRPQPEWVDALVEWATP